MQNNAGLWCDKDRIIHFHARKVICRQTSALHFYINKYTRLYLLFLACANTALNVRTTRYLYGCEGTVHCTALPVNAVHIVSWARGCNKQEINARCGIKLYMCNIEVVKDA